MIRRGIISAYAAVFGIVFLFPAMSVAADKPTLAELERQRAEQQAEIMRLQAAIAAEQARIAAENKAGELPCNPPKTFTVSLDCSKYTGAAREMCLQARKEPNEHERSHFINSMCRKAYAQGRKGNCIHLGWDAKGNPIMTWVDEPAGTIPNLISSNCTPSFFRSCNRYSTYLLQPKTPAPSKWDNISYLFDEWGAYNVGGRERLDKALNGGKKDLLINIVEGPMDFVVIAASIVQYEKTTSPDNFKNQEFRDFVRAQIEASIAIVRDAYAAQANQGAFKGETGGHTRAVYEQFVRSQQAQLLRQIYGNAWFDATFNISFN